VWRPFSAPDASAATSQTSGTERGAEHRIDGRIRDVLNELVSRPQRGANGRFVAGNPAHLEGLEHSAQLKAALAPLKRELADRVRVQLAADTEDAPETLLGVIDMYCEARLLRSSAFIRMSQLGGFMTSKGKARALLGTWASAFDREMRAVERLGLARQTRHVQHSTRDWLLNDDDHDDDTQAEHGDEVI
jgi:hypothetical protein